MSSITGTSAAYSMEVLGASLSKAQQVQQGNQTLKLIETAGATQTQTAAPAAPVGNIGQNIDIKV